MRIRFRFSTTYSFALENRIVSSAYYKETMPLDLKSSSKPLIRPLSTALFNILERPSPTRLKRKGDKGSPCLKPLPSLKYALSFPLTKIPRDPPVTIYLTQFIQTRSNP
jgi:hypothetical protein